MSDAENVKLFTEESKGVLCPTKPQSLNKEAALFITRMVISELDELLCTVTNNATERDQLLNEAVQTRDPCTNFKPSYQDEADLIGAQGDALVDSWYYSLNTAAKHGINLSKIFNLVHDANMAKRDLTTGKFLRRESDGKVIKPVGWQSPDIRAEIVRQTKEGSW